MTEKWERQWSTMVVPNPADHPAFSTVFRAMGGYQESPYVPPTYSSQHHRSLPSLPLPDSNLNSSSGIVGTSVDATLYWWDELSQEQIFQAGTTDPLGLYQYLPAKHVTSPTTPCATSTWHSSWNWHKGRTHGGASTPGIQQIPTPLSSWQSPSNIDDLQVHDPSRTPRGKSEQVQTSPSASRQNDVAGTPASTPRWCLSFQCLLTSAATK